MLHSRQDFAFRCSITLQLACDDHSRHVVQAFEALEKECLGGVLVAAALAPDIKQIAILIHRSPEVMLFASKRENDLIQIPLVATTRAAMAQFIGIGLPKLQTPLPHRFIGHDNPALCQKFLNISITEREVKIEPHCVADNLGWETEAFVVRRSGVCFHARNMSYDGFSGQANSQVDNTPTNAGRSVWFDRPVQWRPLDAACETGGSE